MAAKGFWTDGHLQCAPGYPRRARLHRQHADPDLHPRLDRLLHRRATAGTGSARGENAGRWNAWTATVTGVAQFHPNGAAAPVPWTLGPISVPAGRGIYAVGVYEIVYWVGGRPDHQWQYVNAGTTGAVAAGAGTHYCVYP